MRKLQLRKDTLSSLSPENAEAIQGGWVTQMIFCISQIKGTCGTCTNCVSECVECGTWGISICRCIEE